MSCFKCVQACPVNALEVDENISCIRLAGKSALNMDDEKCNECGICIELCPMDEMSHSKIDCSYCIICKDNPACILPEGKRMTLANLFGSSIRYIFFKFSVTARYFAAKFRTA